MGTVVIRGPTRGTSRVLRTVGHDGHSGNVGRSKVDKAAIYVRRAVEGEERRFGSACDFAGHEVPMAELNCQPGPTSKLMTRAREMEK